MATELIYLPPIIGNQGCSRFLQANALKNALMTSTLQSSEFAQEVLRLTNEFRADHGLSPLTLNEVLTITAQKYSQLMAEEDFFSHIGKDGSAPWERAAVEGYTARAVGENIAAGQSTPEEVVEGWIDSASHRQNLLNPNYTELGVGYFVLENDTGQVNYGHYWTQLFGSGNLTANLPADRTDINLTHVINDDPGESLQLRGLTLTDAGTLQLGDPVSYRLETSRRDIDIQELLINRGSAHDAIALIPVNSSPTLIEQLLIHPSIDLAIGG